MTESVTPGFLTRSKTTQNQANNIMKSKVQEFPNFNYKDCNLWVAYQDKFAAWAPENFKNASQSV